MVDFNLKFIKVILFFLILVGCSDNEPVPNNNNQEISPIVAVDIKFVNENGSDIGVDECISDLDNVAVAITTEIQGTTDVVPTQINYTVNGFLFSMTFNSATTLMNPIDLFDGINIAQLSDSGQTAEVRFVKQGDFEEVP